MSSKIRVEVAYASVETQRVIEVEVSEGTTIEGAIQASGMLTVFPEIDLTQLKVGVFSKARQLSDVVKAGDRIEIYRGLIINPMDARRGRTKLANRKKGKRRGL